MNMYLIDTLPYPSRYLGAVPYPSKSRIDTYPSRYRIICNGTDSCRVRLGDNYLGDNYLNCICNYRYRLLSKLLFLHPFMQWFSPFCHFVYCLLPTCNVQYCLTLLQFPRGESPAPRTIQRPANHNKSILYGCCAKLIVLTRQAFTARSSSECMPHAPVHYARIIPTVLLEYN